MIVQFGDLESGPGLLFLLVVLIVLVAALAVVVVLILAIVGCWPAKRKSTPSGFEVLPPGSRDHHRS